MAANTEVHELYWQHVHSCPRNAPAVESCACDVCGNSTVQPRYRIDGTPYSIMQCTVCGLGKLTPMPNCVEIKSFYPAAYYGRGGRKFARSVEWVVRFVGARHARFLARKIPQGGSVLDVGCGRGVTLRALADTGINAHGFEIVEGATDGLDPRIQFRVAPSLAEAQYPNDLFDGVIFWHVLEHVPRPRETLAEAFRILKPGGVLIVAVPNFSSYQSRWAGSAWFHLDVPRHLYHFPVEVLKELLESIGFRYESEHHFSLRQNPFGWIQSAMNKLPWLPRNSLYALLHRRRDRKQLPFPRALRWQLWAGLCLLAPLAVVLSVVAALARSGATVHIVARRPL